MICIKRNLRTKRMVAAVVLLLSVCGIQVRADTILYSDRADWCTAVGVYWDTDLAQLQGSYTANNAIVLPGPHPDSLSFDQGATVARDSRFTDYIGNSSEGGVVMSFSGGTIEGTFNSGNMNKFGFEFLSAQGGTITGADFNYPFQGSSEVQFFGWISGVNDIPYFSITTSGPILVANFVVPDAGMTMWLLSSSLLGLAILRRQVSRAELPF